MSTYDEDDRLRARLRNLTTTGLIAFAESIDDRQELTPLEEELLSRLKVLA